MFKRMNHSEYPKSLKSKSDESLRYIIKDASEAAAAMPESPNASYYLDEVCYAVNELARRAKKAA